MPITNTAPVFHEASPVGKALIDFNNANDISQSVAVLPSGQILVAGYSASGDFSLARLDSNGTLDTTFSGDGKIPFDILGNTDQAFSMYVVKEGLDAGKILIAGHSYTGNERGLADFSIIRLNADGTLDTSFSTDGKASFEISIYDDFATSVIVQSDGTILMGGYTTDIESSTNFSVIRLLANGDLDTSFGTDGKANIDINVFDKGTGMVLSGDRILIGGSSASTGGSNFSVVCLKANGTLDETFNGGGKASFDLGGHDTGNSVTVQADGMILVAGYTTDSNNSSQFSVIRLLANGDLDTSFGVGGKFLADIGRIEDIGTSVTVHDGKILIVGTSYNGHDNDFAIIRLNSDGTPDTTFSLNGKATFDLGGGNNDAVSSVTVQADGKILIAGTSSNGSNDDFSLIRLNGDGSLDTSFNSLVSLPQSSTLGGSITYSTGDAAAKLDTKVIIHDAELAALDDSIGNYNGASVTLSRHGGTSAQDVFSGTDNLSLSGGNAVLSGVTVGTFSLTGGTLVISFNASATQARVNEVLSSIGYANASNTPPSSVQIDWLFNDGDSAGALTAAGSTQVTITNPNTPIIITGSLAQGQQLTADTSALTDPDGMGPISYQWKADGVAIDGATASTLTLTQDHVGKIITVTASYTDGKGTAESVTSSTNAAVANVNDDPIGGVTLGGTATQGQILTATIDTLDDLDGMGAVSYQWKAGDQVIANATGNTLTLTQDHVGKIITVTASYIDGFGKAESVSSSTSAAVTNVNDAPIGGVILSDTATQGQILTATIDTLDDLDGMGAVSYQWKAGDQVIANATGNTLTLTQDHVGKIITVTASYTDAQGTAESVTSSTSAAVANVNDTPIGGVILSNTATQGQILTATIDTLDDLDGMGAVSYQWKAGDQVIANATGNTLTLTQDHVGKIITVTASYTDAQGTAESVTSSTSAAVANVNDTPIGGVILSNTATQGQILTATIDTLDDLDGMGAVSYQWKAGDQVIANATGNTLTLTQDHVGKIITVTASYTDGKGTAESVTSSTSAAVANVNDTPIGGVILSDTATQGQILTATIDTLNDLDGMGAVSYQWKAGDQVIANATGNTLTLTQDHVGKIITVTASYTDAQGTAESVTSSTSAAVANVNDTPIGGVILSNTATQGQILTATIDTLDDLDGMGAVSYQWKAGDQVIANATGNTLTLTQDHVGKIITVTASYTDAQGTAESVTSSTNAAVANVNDTPIGGVILSDTATQGQILTATIDTLKDLDGMGAVSYQWKAGDQVIANATGNTLTLTQDHVGKIITVTASYTDGKGTAESVTSSTNAAVANVNDTPIGGVILSGTATQGHILTADNDLKDLDGMVNASVTYQWKADGDAISGATGKTFLLGQDQVGKVITVTASYTDDKGALESKTSAASAAVIALDSIAPTVTLFTPADEATKVAPDSNIVLTFSEAVVMGTGNIVLKTAAGTVIATYDVTISPNLTLSNDKTTLTLDPSSNLAVNTAYKVELAAGTFKDLAGNDFAGSTSYNFTTTGNTYTGTANADKLTGSVGDDTLNGLAGNDVLNGYIGADTMTGGDGSDTYYVDNVGDVVIETNASASTGGTDIVYSYLSAYTLGANVENGRILATGTANLTGNSLDNVLYAGVGNNVLNGGAGTDTVSYAYGISGTTGVKVSLATTAAQVTGGSGTDTLLSIENLIGSNYADTLTGNSGNNSLSGGAGNDTLNGGTGADSMTGGDGSDSYYVDNIGDKVVETNATASTGGTDIVYSYLSAYTLGANVENGRILATGTANLTGNSLNNVLYAGLGDNVLNGGAGTDTVSYAYGISGTTGVKVSLATTAAQVTGGSGTDTLLSIENLIGSNYADTLTGSTGNNSLSGGAGNDTLNGGTGADTLTGGDGSDTYYVDNVGDKVVETNASASTGGTDIVYSYLSAYTLGANVENGRILATGTANLTGNSLDNVLYAGVGNNVLNGGAGTDTVSYAYGISGTTGVKVSLATTAAQVTGGSGTDTLLSIENLIGSNYADTLTGSTGNNSLSGGAGNDTLNGGTGADSMTGGDGSDSYYVDNIGDKVVETNATASTGGTDIVYSYLSAYTLGANVENGRILATGTANLTGNSLDNVLYAGVGNNVLNGGAGTDTVSYAYGISGTTGVKVSLATTAAQVTGGSGTDTLLSIENLIGSNYADTLTGNSGNNSLSGGAGNDTLNGGTGADTLTGGTGADRFVFSNLTETGLTSTTWDTITDFKTSEGDKIDLLGVDANTALTGDQAFTFLGSVSAFTGDATGKLRFDAVTHTLYGSTDADTAAEFAIVLTGVNSLSTTNFLL